MAKCLLAEAIAAELDGTPAFAAYHRRRDRAVRPMYRFTVGLAEHAPGTVERLLFTALADRPGEVTRFLGAFSGVVPPDTYFTPSTLLRLVGGRAVRQLTGARCSAGPA